MVGSTIYDKLIHQKNTIVQKGPSRMHSMKEMNLLVSAVGILGLCGDGDMRNMTDTCQGFASEAICRHGRQIIKRPQLAGSESFADNGQVSNLQVKDVSTKLVRR